MHVTPAVANLIRDGRGHQIASQLQLGRKQGMIELDARLKEMLDAGIITIETAREHAKNPGRFD